MKIAWFGDFGGYLPFDDGILDVNRKALAVLSDIGCEIEEITPDFDLPELWQAWLTLRSFNVAHGMRANYEQPEKRALFNPQYLFEFDVALGKSAADTHAASTVRSRWYKYMLSLVAHYNFLVMPAAQVFPFDVDMKWPTDIAGVKMDTYNRWMEVVIGATPAGLPVAAMPAGFSAIGLPAGVQFVGPPRGDRTTLEFALAYERAAGIARRREWRR